PARADLRVGRVADDLAVSGLGPMEMERARGVGRGGSTAGRGPGPPEPLLGRRGAAARLDQGGRRLADRGLQPLRVPRVGSGLRQSIEDVPGPVEGTSRGGVLELGFEYVLTLLGRRCPNRGLRPGRGGLVFGLFRFEL